MNTYIYDMKTKFMLRNSDKLKHLRTSQGLKEILIF